MNRIGYIYIRNVYAGILEETDEGYSFKYDNEYLKRDDSSSISLTMPKREEAYTSSTFFPFFDGLIPEGWLLDVVADNWKINKKDRFGLLLVSGKDPIGNVSIKEAKE